MFFKPVDHVVNLGQAFRILSPEKTAGRGFCNLFQGIQINIHFLIDITPAKQSIHEKRRLAFCSNTDGINFHALVSRDPGTVLPAELS